jgi:HK97 family phage major capsid protein
VTREKYLEQRNALMAEIEVLIAEGKVDESNTKMDEVKELDNQWEQVKLANANLNALKDNVVGLELENQGLEVKGGKEVADFGKEIKVDEAKVYEMAWAKTLQGKKLEGAEQEVFNKVNAEFSNAYTHDTGNTPTLIPQTVVAGIWKRAEEMYPLLGDIRKYNVKGTLVINRHDSIALGDAAWYDEDTATADEKNVFGQLTLTGCELAKAITVSWKLRAMAVEDFIPYIKNELGERVGVALGTAIAQGKGQPGASDDWKPEPQGIETALAAENNTPQIVTYNPTAATPDPADYEKITSLVAKLHSSYLSGAAFYANNATIWTVLANIVDTTGRPIFIPDTTAGGVGRMLGFVVKADAGVSANNVIFGNANKGYVFNTNEPMSLATEEHVKARTVDYAAYTIVDGAVLDTKAFALLKKSS